MGIDREAARRLANAFDNIARIDATITSIAGDIEAQADQWGEKVRDVFGRNRFGSFRNQTVGRIAAAAIIGALLRLRVDLVEGIVEVGGDAPAAPDVSDATEITDWS